MTTATSSPRKPRSKPARSARLGPIVRGNQGRNLDLTVGKDVFGYLLTALRSEVGGRGFRLQKLAHQVEAGGVDHYDVLLDGSRSTCECKGWLQHGQRRGGFNPCKHISACLALVSAGKL